MYSKSAHLPTYPGLRGAVCDVNRRDFRSSARLAGRRFLGDPRVFGRRTWVATREEILAVRANVSIVWQRGWMRKGLRRGVPNEEQSYVHGGRYVVEGAQFQFLCQFTAFSKPVYETLRHGPANSKSMRLNTHVRFSLSCQPPCVICQFPTSTSTARTQTNRLSLNF